MPLTKVLITVKTYPSISTKYEELVCTAGFREDGSWIRIYPIQFRKRPFHEQYRKYQWVEIDLIKNTSDPRPESFRPISHDTPINVLGSIPSDGNYWTDRRQIVLKKTYTSLAHLIGEAKNKEICTSLAVFKPTRILDFTWQEDEREWTKKKLAQFQQLNLFQEVASQKLQIVRKLPYKFSFKFEDEDKKSSTLMIEDWETGQLYWNCLERRGGDEKDACNDVYRKYFEDFAQTKDLYFFLGTTQLHHFRAPNPYVIIGTFHPKPLPKNPQLELFN